MKEEEKKKMNYMLMKIGGKVKGYMDVRSSSKEEREKSRK